MEISQKEAEVILWAIFANVTDHSGYDYGEEELQKRIIENYPELKDIADLTDSCR